MSTEQTYPSDSSGGIAVALDLELAKRVQSLSEHPHTVSECHSSTRSCFVEAAFWGCLGAIIWVATLAYFG